ncbi:MAG: polyribonucleotide nucleotidyltransferase [Candidatus Dojkabacteria bacterium]
MNEISKSYTVDGKEIKLSTGKLARLANGSVLLEMGGTSVLATVAVDKKDSSQDFFPLSVEYIERMYARGAISGSKFLKREGYPSEDAIIKARQVDHSIRSLFPKGFKKAVGVVLTVMSYDGVNDPETLAVYGASISLMLAGLPYHGPSAGAVTGITEEGEIVINPEAKGREELKAELFISGVNDRFLNIEGWAKEVPEDLMDKALNKAMDYIKELNKTQTDFVNEVFEKQGKPTFDYKIDESVNIELPAPEELINKIKELKYDAIKESIFQPEKADRNVYLDIIKSELEEPLKDAEGNSPDTMDVTNAIEYIAKKILRSHILKDDVRRLERGLLEIRPLFAEVDILPTVHGSALFTRGLTQSLSIVTLASQGMAQLQDNMEGEDTKSFMHHYNMPPFSTGEAGRYSYKPGRREIGHGAIGENALKNMVPSQEVFPYTIRVVSEILSSNGSTSMAATCASSMALMAAGVPMKEQVAGIGVGLITEDGDESKYKLILDIEGVEDFYGDMDFKVTGTKNGITAIQYENKLRGVPAKIIREAFQIAKDGRLQVLEVMNAAIATPRTELAPTAPVVGTLNINKERIGELIGPGGKNIKELVQRGKDKFDGKIVDINIDDTGRVAVTASNKDQLDFVTGIIHNMFEEAEVGKVYTAIVDKIMPYGVFVNVSQSITGLCHVSEISEKRNIDLNEVFNDGDSIQVKVIKNEEGRLSFSMKDVEQTEELKQRIANAPQAAPQQDMGRRPEGRFNNRDRGDRKFDRR